jgi:hypothetical protein
VSNGILADLLAVAEAMLLLQSVQATNVDHSESREAI